jgi:glycosyltransferase involved in cell wall biosynthesis
VPETAAASIPQLKERGFAAATFAMARAEPQLLADGKTIAAIATTLADWRAHVVLGCGAKPMLLGALAAKKAGVTRRVGLLTALPGPMVADAAAQPSWGWRRLMKAGFKALDGLVCYNDSQRARLQAQGLLPKGLVPTQVAGAGVDLARNAVQPLPPMVIDGRPALDFLMVARKDAAKGAVEFCEAARLVREKAPDTRFILAGPDGDLPEASLAGYHDCVQILPDQPDVRALIGAAHVVVVPSWCEAMPRVLLEALAAGRPVIASAIAGCREAVDERVNGVLVPPRDSHALAAAMMSYLKRPDLIPAMARASRAKAERRFDVRAVNATLLEVLGL